MNRKQFVLTLISLCLFALVGGMVSVQVFSGQPVMAGENRSDDARLLGIVKQGKFYVLFPQRPVIAAVRLTKIQMQEARPPDSAELDLTEYEGKAIMVTGFDGGGWVYRASVIDSGGPIVTALVEQVFSEKKRAASPAHEGAIPGKSQEH